MRAKSFILGSDCRGCDLVLVWFVGERRKCSVVRDLTLIAEVGSIDIEQDVSTRAIKRWDESYELSQIHFENRKQREQAPTRQKGN